MVSENNEHPAPQDGQDHTRRDSETQIVLGAFVSVIALPVLVGTFWAETPHARIVNIVAGLVLLGIGLGMVAWGFRTKKKIT